MKDAIVELIQQALTQMAQDADWPQGLEPNVQLERTRDKSHGDWASNVAMTLAKPLRANPRQIAERIVAALPASDTVSKVDIAGPGFINFTLNEAAAYEVIRHIFDQRQNYGRGEANGKKVQVEFASVNPTGPLHVGHGRGSAYGATLANLLAAAGYDVHKEYYVNDAGRQMDILAASVWLRYLQSCGEELAFASNAYQGDYIKELAEQLKQAEGDSLRHSSAAVFAEVPADEPQGGDKEQHIDGIINNAKALLGEDYAKVFELGLNGILADIREDLAEFGVEFDEWFSEKSLTVSPSQVDKAIALLQEKGHIEERDGALWFLSTAFGDDKDRVVKRDNGQTTYFASDIAYHLNKFERGFDTVIDVWGADHHGYIARVKAALEALGIDPSRLVVRLIQLVSLYRGDEPVKMSTRSGSFITLRELRDEVGKDAARYFYIMKKADQATDFDLELAKSESKDNPVYYIQYAHARVCSVMRKLEEHGWSWDESQALEQLSQLSEDSEKDLLTQLARYPEVLANAAANHEPHSFANYLRDLAANFHTWYNGHKMLIDDEALRNARLALSEAVRQVLSNGLEILGVSAPETM